MLCTRDADMHKLVWIFNINEFIIHSTETKYLWSFLQILSQFKYFSASKTLEILINVIILQYKDLNRKFESLKRCDLGEINLSSF